MVTVTFQGSVKTGNIPVPPCEKLFAIIISDSLWRLDRVVYEIYAAVLPVIKEVKGA
jgi:hypothetical protein